MRNKKRKAKRHPVVFVCTAQCVRTVQYLTLCTPVVIPFRAVPTNHRRQISGFFISPQRSLSVAYNLATQLLYNQAPRISASASAC